MPSAAAVPMIEPDPLASQGSVPAGDGQRRHDPRAVVRILVEPGQDLHERTRRQVGIARQARPVRDHCASPVDAPVGQHLADHRASRVGGRARYDAEVAHQRLRVEVLALLQHVDADRGERFGPVADERAQPQQGGGLVPRRERVDVDRLAVHRNAMLLQGVLERLHEEEGRIADRRGPHDRGGALRDPPGYHQRGSPRQPPQPNAGRPIGAHGDDVVAQDQVGSGVSETCARGSARRSARFDHHLDHVLAVLQRSRRRGESAREVVPGPPAPEAGGFEGPVVEDVVVADDAPGDAAHAEAAQLVGPVDEDVPRARGVDRGIAGAADHEVAQQRSVTDRCGGEQGRLEAVVPPEPFGGGREGDELHRRGGIQQHVGVTRVEALAAVEHPDVDTPDDGTDVARGQQPIETPSQIEVGPPTGGAGLVRARDVRRPRTFGGRSLVRCSSRRTGGRGTLDWRACRRNRRAGRRGAAICVGGSGGARKGNRCAGARHATGHQDGKQNRCDTKCSHVEGSLALIYRQEGARAPRCRGSHWRDPRRSRPGAKGGQSVETPGSSASSASRASSRASVSTTAAPGSSPCTP